MEILIVISMSFAVYEATDIENPVLDFIALNPQYNGRIFEVSEIEVRKIDITGDEIPEIFIRNTAVPYDRYGPQWVVYERREGSFSRIWPPLIMYPKDNSRRFRSVKGTNFITVTPGNHDVAFIATRLIDGEFEREKIRVVESFDSEQDRAWLASEWESLVHRAQTIKLSELDNYDMSEILDLTPDRVLSEVKNSTDNEANTSLPEPASDVEEAVIEAPQEAALTQTSSVQEPADVQPEIVATTTEIVQQPESGTSEPLAPSRNYVPYIVVGLLLAGAAAFAYKVSKRR